MTYHRDRPLIEVDRPLWRGRVQPFHILFGFAHLTGALVALLLFAAGVGGVVHHGRRWRE